VKVSELIEILSYCDPDANVIIVEQPNWPLEHALAGVAVRNEFSHDTSDGRDGGDVVLVEGQQLRYGSRDAWSAMVRR
jgi:hypothetical protein